MQLKAFFSNWTQVAGLLLIGGALAWTIKLCVIISTNGRIIDTGAAALFMKIGLLMLVIGSTGVGSYLSLHRATWLRTIAMLLSPVAVFVLLFPVGIFLSSLVKNSSVWYTEQEAPIALAVVVYMAIGCFLYKSYKPVTRKVV